MNKYLIFATRKGLVKKTLIEEYANIRQTGLLAITLDQDDQLLNVHPTCGDDLVLMITRSGKSILFHENEIRPTGRATRGVRGIKLSRDDQVIGMDIISAEEVAKSVELSVLVISENGYGKQTIFPEYNQQGRGGQGVFTAKLSGRTGALADMRVLRPDTSITETPPQDLLVISQHGQAIRLSLKDVPKLGRHTQGVRILKLDAGDKVSALALL